MRLLVSCKDGGLIKEIGCNLGTDTSKKDALQPIFVKDSMADGSAKFVNCWYSLEVDHTKTIFVRNNGSLQLAKMTYKPMEDLETVENIDWEIIDEINDPKLLDNKVLESVFQKSARRTKIIDEFITLKPLNPEENKFILATKSGWIHIISLAKDKLSKEISHQVKAPLDFLQIYDNEDTNGEIVFAVGGEDNLVKLFKLQDNFEKLEMIWEAKNVKNDRLDMKVPIWPVSLKFLDPKPNDTDDTDKLNYQFVVITHYSHLGIYQTQHGKKPLKYIDLLPNREPLSTLELVNINGDAEDEFELTKMGNLKSNDLTNFQFITSDLKKNVMRFNETGRLLGKYGKTDIVGASSYIQFVHGTNYLLQGGLDKYLRVFDVTTLKTLVKVYVGSKINYIELLDDIELEVPQADTNTTTETKDAKKKRSIRALEETEDDAESLWESLESSKKSKNR